LFLTPLYNFYLFSISFSNPNLSYFIFLIWSLIFWLFFWVFCWIHFFLFLFFISILILILLIVFFLLWNWFFFSISPFN
jgi:hypothetical protein